MTSTTRPSLICKVCGVPQNRSRAVEFLSGLLFAIFLLFFFISSVTQDVDIPQNVRSLMVIFFLITIAIFGLPLKVALQLRNRCIRCKKSVLIPINTPIGREMMESQQAHTEMAIQDAESGKNSVVERDNRFRLTSRTL